MPFARILCRVVIYAVTVSLLAACSKPSLVDDNLTAGGEPRTEFSIDDQSVTLSARFSARLAADDAIMVEWLFPDGTTYLRKPVRRAVDTPDRIETTMPIHGKAPARHPGLWHVRLWLDGDKLVDRLFEVRMPARTPASAAAGFASLAFCGPSRWSDPVISARRSGPVASGVPGAWVGRELLEAAGATYSSAVLLTGCAPS